MEKSRIFVIIIAILGLLALVLQATGYFGPAWMAYDMNIDDHRYNKVSTSISMGLWTTTACVDMGRLRGEVCKALTNDEIRRSLKGATGSGSNTQKAESLNFLDDFDKVKALATIGGLLSFVGLVCAILFTRASGTKTAGIISAVSWGLGAVFWFAAIGVQAKQNSDFQDGIDVLKTIPEVADILKLKTHFPWAILVAGLGAGLNLVMVGIITVKICFMNDLNVPAAPAAPAPWGKPNNPV